MRYLFVWHDRHNLVGVTRFERATPASRRQSPDCSHLVFVQLQHSWTRVSMTENDTLCQQVTEDRHVVRQQLLHALRTRLTAALKSGTIVLNLLYFLAKQKACCPCCVSLSQNGWTRCQPMIPEPFGPA